MPDTLVSTRVLWEGAVRGKIAPAMLDFSRVGALLERASTPHLGSTARRVQHALSGFLPSPQSLAPPGIPQ
ncbi:MAG: hypothetical protein ABW061_04595 [Polyangiaceae bacterium]